jgi:hypothetical protein
MPRNVFRSVDLASPSGRRGRPKEKPSLYVTAPIGFRLSTAASRASSLEAGATPAMSISTNSRPTGRAETPPATATSLDCGRRIMKRGKIPGSGWHGLRISGNKRANNKRRRSQAKYQLTHFRSSVSRRLRVALVATLANILDWRINKILNFQLEEGLRPPHCRDRCPRFQAPRPTAA